MEMTLNHLKPGQKASIISIGGKGAIRRRLIDMGITPGTEVFMRKTSPFGDPMEINIRGYELCLRKTEAEQVKVDRS